MVTGIGIINNTTGATNNNNLLTPENSFKLWKKAAIEGDLLAFVKTLDPESANKDIIRLIEDSPFAKRLMASLKNSSITIGEKQDSYDDIKIYNLTSHNIEVGSMTFRKSKGDYLITGVHFNCG